MSIYQLDLFKDDEDCRIETIERDLIATTKSLNNVRKGTYASINELKKIVLELNERIKIIERNLCR